MAKNSYGGRVANSEWVRYRKGKDGKGLWLPVRKRTYYLWHTFLQHAESAPNTEFEVDWSKYRGWGGANEVKGMKFDLWWEDKWEKLFAYKEKSQPLNKQRFPLSSTHIKYEAVRLSLLVYEFRNTKPDMSARDYGGADLHLSKRRGGNALAIAKRVIAREKNKKRSTYTGTIDVEQASDGEQGVQTRIGRYLRAAKKTMGKVCEGTFP